MPTLSQLRQPAESPRIRARGEFVAGFLGAGGSPDMARRFIWIILPCESAGQPPGGYIDWTPGGYFYTAAQIHPGNWGKIEAAAGRSLSFEDPYDVGVAAATWLQLIGEENIATRGGWECAA